MKRIYDHVYKGRVPPNLQFSVLNLSLDYPDNKREEYLELSEICNTRRLLMKVLELIAGDATR